ncbi:MAG: hypothetical protein J2P15_17790 [Micromonosporaceae bacterium]|nr:hypothetical protein [Micromonosporaceae bacterium]
MTDPSADEDFVDTSDHLDPDERDIEAPEADAAEQALPADPVQQPVEVQRGLEVGEWDAVEQARVVDLDEDYR